MRNRSLTARALTAGATLVVAGLACAAPVCAKTIKMPEAAPQVIFEVPDDWTVTPTALGLNLAPPDKSALIVSGLIKRERTTLTKWQKDATQEMRQFGIAFDPKATKPAASKAPAAPTTLFSGAPTIATPEQGPKAATAFEDKDKDKAGLSLEELTGRAPPKGAKIPVNGLVVYGASYLGTPVDVEFLNFALSTKELFLMQQESGKIDDRIAAIVDTVRRPAP